MPRAAAVLAAVALSGCIAGRPCPAAGLAATACAASRGDKAAQLVLGRAYETGSGVPLDARRAARLYGAAAAATSGTTFVYAPGVGQARGQVIPVRTGADVAGLPLAKYRLGRMLIEGRGIKPDVDRGRRLIAQAALIDPPP